MFVEFTTVQEEKGIIRWDKIIAVYPHVYKDTITILHVEDEFYINIKESVEEMQDRINVVQAAALAYKQLIQNKED